MTKRALCIGINDYPGTGSDLAGCVNDANDWTSVLAKRGFTVQRLRDRPAPGTARREGGRLGPRRAGRPSSPPGRYAALLMAGCQDTEYSYDAYFRGRPNGAFTFVALRALAALPAQGPHPAWLKAT